MIHWIVSTPRSGSNYITGEIWRRLGSTPKPMEYFNLKSVQWRPGFNPDQAAPVRSYLDYLVDSEAHNGRLLVKILWDQIRACCQYPDFLSELQGCKIIFLRRRDAIRQGISMYLMRQTGAWSSIAKATKLSAESVPYHYRGIARAVVAIERQAAQLDRFLHALELEHISVFYEDFRSAPEWESDRILHYLGVAEAAAAMPTAEVFKKQSGDVNERFYQWFVADERRRLLGDGSYRGEPLFAVDPAETPQQGLDGICG